MVGGVVGKFPQDRSASQLPRHLAVILDGNRRWAYQHGRAELEAYRIGALRVNDLALWCDEAGISVVTVWVLSLDNLHRGAASVSMIVSTVVERLEKMAATGRWRIRTIGSLQLLGPDKAAALCAVSDATEKIDGMTINVAIAYSGRGDIVQAVSALLLRGDLGTNQVTEQQLEGLLSTAGQPDIDLVIRTSGEQRLSGFMPWQTAEAELYFTETPWPDFDRSSFEKALQWYAIRNRRFGR